MTASHTYNRPLLSLHSSPYTIANTDLARAETERNEKAAKPESIAQKSFFRKSPFISNPQHCPNTSMERLKPFYFIIHLAFVFGHWQSRRCHDASP